MTPDLLDRLVAHGTTYAARLYQAILGSVGNVTLGPSPLTLLEWLVLARAMVAWIGHRRNKVYLSTAHRPKCTASMKFFGTCQS